MTYAIEVEIYTDWHAGTGKGIGAGVDAVTRRDTDGLPMLPGAHIRGLLRHALQLAETYGHIEQGQTHALLGGAPPESDEDIPDQVMAYQTTQGRLHVESARLPQAWRDYAQSDTGREACLHLTRSVQATKLQDGVVAARTLRSVEIAVPMTLIAPIWGDLNNQDIDAIRLALGFIRRVGGHRTRGLGRARLTLKEV
ncbi:hypothetical protein KKF91_09165 [Myxococcota bacterium]|nr:hypothetical protein [Myxococcota bacterium]